MVYDRAEYHEEYVEEHGLPTEHAGNHTVVFIRWALERGMLSPQFKTDAAEILDQVQQGSATVHDLYEWCDGCFSSEMLSDEGNAFALHYFDFEKGSYLDDYIHALQGSLPSELHVPYNDKNYTMMRAIIDRRFTEWKHPPKKGWWPFGKK